MSKEAEISMMLYTGLHKHEENKLKKIETNVVKIMLEKGDNRRPIWTNTYIMNSCLLQLVIPGTSQPKTLFELPEEQFTNLFESDIVLQIKNKMG
ncbi:MAG: hypothetical protein H0Z29_10505 [Candidatus Marinimicrobia bacterium]|nr:hypothetical protein [Candidatus Neomarinimicrobiota bacterium]